MRKYEERAKDILNKSLEWLNDNYDMSEDETKSVIKAMCQLAEEVEKSCNEINYTYRQLLKLKEKGEILYTKEQVEELLQKQRELSSKKVEESYIEENGDVNPLLLSYVILNEKVKID